MEYFDLDELERGGLVATQTLLSGFQRAHNGTYLCTLYTPRRVIAFEVTAELLPAIAQVTRAAVAADPDELREMLGDQVDALLVDAFLEAIADDAPYGWWPAINDPAVHRREHASLVVRSAESCLVVDPQCLSATWTTNGGRCPADPAGHFSASVLITHSHADHFHLPSIMRWIGDSDRAIVPYVPAPTVLSEDMAGMVGSAFPDQVAVPSWWSSHRLGDVDLHVLPFYGEQPTRRLRAAAPELQNWGNCYRVDLPDYSLAILADSGADERGSMLDVLARSVDQHGPIDILVTCCLDFPEAINEGLPHYVLLVPFCDLERLARDHERESITLGTHGIVEACAVAQARFLMPYAHGYDGLGVHPRSEALVSEDSLLRTISANLAHQGAATEVVSWLPGQMMIWHNGRPVVRAR